VPFPDPYRPILEVKPGEDYGVKVVEYIEEQILGHLLPPEDVAGILLEPIQGEGGYVLPTPGFFPALRQLCDKYEILLIADEVQSGMGRTGKWWAIEHFGVEPDIVCAAKGIASGMPLGVMFAKEHIVKWPRGAHGNTYGGNPLSCGAAIATLDLVQSQYAANAARVGEHFLGRLREMMSDYPCIGEVRGRGLMIGMELIENDADRTPARALCDRLVTRGYYNGLLLLSCGVSTLRFMPPLSTTVAEVDEAIVLLRAALDEALQGKGG